MLRLMLAVVLLGVVSAQSVCDYQNSAGRIYMNNADCSYYIQCDGRTEHRIAPCQPNEMFDPWRHICVSATENVNCTLDYQYFDRLCSRTQSGTVAMPDDCAKYLQCWDNIFVFPPSQCAHGTLYNEEKYMCDLTDNDQGQCGNRPFYSNTNDRKPCILRPMRGDCNRYCDCKNPLDCRSCGKTTFLSESQHACVSCHQLTDEEKQYCNLRC